MSARDAVIAEFLNEAGWMGAKRAPLAGDASSRRYERVSQAGRKAVLMDAPPEPGEVAAGAGAVRASGYSAAARLAVDCAPFVAIGTHLAAQGFSAPKIFAADIAKGLLLLEDLGDGLFGAMLADPIERRAEPQLYEAAVDFLADFHTRPHPGELPVTPGRRFALNRYEPSVYQIEADLLIDWYLPALRGAGVSPAERDAYRSAWGRAFEQIDKSEIVLCLRDYHSPNIMWLPDRAGTARVGLLDFQDGLLGSPAYDLVSLLQDARRDVDPALQAAMLERYIAASKSRANFDEQRFRLAYAILGAQRNSKIVGIFTRLSRRDGKPQYLRHMPRLWRYLSADLAHPMLAPLRTWFDQNIPASARKDAPAAEGGFAPAQKVAS
jgi:aminoglycoside/choline kinase family phosphotransferase